jgi:superkiller protein 3
VHLVYDIDLLHKFAKTYPQAALTDFIDDYCRWFKLPLPEPEEEENSTPAIESGDAEARKVAAKKRPRRGKAGLNARERRKTRRAAGKEGTLAEDVDQEERDELVGTMTVR